MRIFTFRVDKDAIRTVKQRMLKAAQTGNPDVRNHEMVCESLSVMFKIASTPKFETFEGIVAYRPSSLYELARLLNRDQAQVLKEARSLEAMGLIKLVLNQDGAREKLKPEPLYDKIVFEVEPKQIAQSA